MKMNHLLVTNVEIGLEPWFFTISLWALGRRLSCSVFHLWNESRLVNTLMRLLHKTRQAGSSMQSLRWCLEPRYVLCKCWQLFQSLCWFSAGEVCSCDLNLVFWKLTKICTWQGSWQQTGAMPPSPRGQLHPRSLLMLAWSTVPQWRKCRVSFCMALVADDVTVEPLALCSGCLSAFFHKRLVSMKQRKSSGPWLQMRLV